MSALNKIQLAKTRYIIAVFLITTVIIGILLVKWQFIDAEKYVLIGNERFKQVRIPSVRGSILARDGSTLAYSEPRFDAYVWLPELSTFEKNGIQTRDEFLKKVSPLIGIESNELEKLLTNGSSWIKVANKLTADQKNSILALTTDKSEKRTISGIQFQYVNKRMYPENRLASQVLGYVSLGNNQDGYKGVWGLEQQWEGILRPQEGYESSEFDSFGNFIAIGEDDVVEPKPGSTIQTTIDKSLQMILEKNLKRGVETFQAEDATGIIMDPKTGEILAMANYPDFDPNNYYSEKSISVFGNLAVSTPYEIGSVGKIFTAAAAIDLGRIDQNTVLLPNGHDGCEIISPDPPADGSCRDLEKNKGGAIIDCICTAEKSPVKESINTARAIVLSDNIAFRHIAMTMSYEEFFNYLIKFGVSKPTKIDVAGESVGVIAQGAKWNYADQAIYSFGHGYSVTPIEAISGAASIANDGARMQPYIISKVIDSNNAVTQFIPKIEAYTVSPEACNTLIPMLHESYVSQLREARYKNLSKYYISLKSGTALIPYKDRPGYSNEIYTTFVGFDASPEHKFIMLIKLSKPKVGTLSWQNVRVVWLDTFNEIKDILKVQPYSP